MTQNDISNIKKLLNLADAAADFEHVDIKLVTHFHTMREELGLARLLLMVQEYVQFKSQGQLDSQIPKISQQS